MSAADLRESVAWAPELLVAMAKAHDQEASAQKGEPSPWDVSIFGELRAAVERVERALSRFEATRIADLDWPTKVSVDPADLRLLLSALTTQLEVERATGDETARHISRLLDHLARETARADAAEAEAKALREAAEPFVRAADAAERNCFPLDGAVFRSALDYDMRALGRDNSEDVYRDSVRTSDLYRLRSIVTRATLAQPAADGGK